MLTHVNRDFARRVLSSTLKTVSAPSVDWERLFASDDSGTLRLARNRVGLPVVP